MHLVLALLLACVPAEAPSPPAQAPAQAPAPAPAAQGKGKAKVPVTVYFADADGTVVPVERHVGANNPPRNAVWSLFKGPNPKEAERGLKLVSSGATGFKSVRVKDGVAHVTLKDGCDGGGSAITVYDLLVPTLAQFEEIQHVKVYSPDGQTAEPSGPSNSRPGCLEP